MHLVNGATHLKKVVVTPAGCVLKVLMLFLKNILKCIPLCGKCVCAIYIQHTTILAHIRRRRLINFYSLWDGVLFEFGQTGVLFQLASYSFYS